MTENIWNIIWFCVKEGMLPVIISIVCCKVQFRMSKRAERNKKVPTMYMIELNGKPTVKVNETRIKRSKYIIEVVDKCYPAIDNITRVEKKLSFQEITYKNLLEKVEKETMLIVGFNNIAEAGLTLRYLKRPHESFEELDKRVMPILVDSADNYCLVFKKKLLPMELTGTYNNYPVSYLIKKCDCIINPTMHKK